MAKYTEVPWMGHMLVEISGKERAAVSHGTEEGVALQDLGERGRCEGFL
jgi:hypothetical protein